MKGVVVAGACALVLLPILVISAATAALTASQTSTPAAAPTRLAGIPTSFLHLYEAAGSHYGLPWELLAAIGKVECDHGQDPDPSCWHDGAMNYAGAGGPMQFLAGTWTSYAVDANHDGHASRWDPADAIYTAARYLRANGAPGDLKRAVYAYNHSSAYVAQVLALMHHYQQEVASTPPIGGISVGDPAALARAVLSDPQIALRSEAVRDISSGRIDPRLLATLLALSRRFQLDGVGPFITGHSFYVAGSTRISNHAGGRAVDIGSIDRQLVSSSSGAARALTLAVLALPVSLRPDEIESPFAALGCGPVRCIVVSDHVHIGYDQ